MRKKTKKSLRRAAVVFSTGALGYGMIEILFRGWTHWSMLLTGGVCFSGLYAINRRMRGAPLLLRCLAGAGLITAAEYAVGMLVNRRLKLHVWDYSHLRGNIQGQICPLFCALWFMLCVPAFGACSLLEKRLK